MSSSVQETVTNEKKPNTRLFHVVVHGGLLCCKFNLVSCRSVVMNGVWSVLERNSSTAFASGNLESAMTKALETGKVYESPQLSET